MGIKVSVIVPIYCVEQYLERAVDSLINQTLKDIEIILVDDGSPDNCGEIIDGYAKKHPNIIAVHKENGGLSDARNAGMEKAAGEYVGFLDPDDYANPEMFEKLYDSASKNQSDIVLCGYKEIFSSVYSEDHGVVFHNSSGGIFDVISETVCGNVGAYVWCKLFRSSIIRENGLKFPYGISLVEDVLFFFDFLRFAKTFSAVDEQLYNYIRQPKSICATYQPKRFEFYKTGADAIEKTVRTFDDPLVSVLLESNRVSELNNLLSTIDVQSGPKNRLPLKKRYSEMSLMATDEHLILLIDKYADRLNSKHQIRQINHIKNKRFKSLFLMELVRMRIIARIKYYLSIGG